MTEPCGLLHRAAAVGATVDIDLEHAAEEPGPQNTVLSAAVAGVLVCQLVVGLREFGGSADDALSFGGSRCATVGAPIHTP